MSNKEIRIRLIEENIKSYQLAKYLGIAPETLSKKLRYEMSEMEKQKIIEAIEELKAGKSS